MRHALQLFDISKLNGDAGHIYVQYYEPDLRSRMNGICTCSLHDATPTATIKSAGTTTPPLIKRQRECCERVAGVLLARLLILQPITGIATFPGVPGQNFWLRDIPCRVHSPSQFSLPLSLGRVVIGAVTCVLALTLPPLHPTFLLLVLVLVLLVLVLLLVLLLLLLLLLFFLVLVTGLRLISTEAIDADVVSRDRHAMCNERALAVCVLRLCAARLDLPTVASHAQPTAQR